MTRDVTILDGATFCVSGPVGDIEAGVHGLYAADTRYLSRMRLLIDGNPLLPLSTGRVEYFSAAFFLRNPVGGSLAPDQLVIRRERFIRDALHEHVIVENVASGRVSFELTLEVASDFADILSVKDHDFALGDPAHATSLPAPVLPHDDDGALVVAAGDGPERTLIIATRPSLLRDGALVWRLELAQHERFELKVTFSPSPNGGSGDIEVDDVHFGAERSRIEASLRAWNLHTPRLTASWDGLAATFNRSISDLASLRMRTGVAGVAQLPAAGVPWFMTVFGRDTLITCLETMLLGPELAYASLTALADLQAQADDASIDAEPGKIVHELRRGRAAERWFARYYGTADATPLFLILISETWRFTADDAFAKRMRVPAQAALRWIDEHGDRDGDGFVEFERRTPNGLEVQSWKDSHDSQRFADGRRATGPIAAVEVQGYVVDAKRRIAELARHAWHDAALASSLEAEAELLARRIDDAFWIERGDGGFYALALDGEKRAVDSTTSNMGHLLWSGVPTPERARQVADALMSRDVFSGWGVRTMSARDSAYNPIAYHNGTVWPHDSALCAWGLARYGLWDQAFVICDRLIEAAAYFGHALPEVFAGFERGETPFPVAYPTASSPQAWAAGAPLLVLRLLLGIEPDPHAKTLRVTRASRVPDHFGELTLRGVRAFGRSFDVALRGGVSEVSP